MATANKLGTSGLLSEGSDFAKWKDALRPILAQHFLDLCWSDHDWEESLPPEVSSDVYDCIWWQVSPHVRSRVPKEYRKDPFQMFQTLRATARSFPFMDLPAEIRLRVYKLELAAKTSQQNLRLLKRGPGKLPTTFQHKYDPLIEPQILATSRQIRIEALPVYYREVGVNLTFNESVYTSYNLNYLTDYCRRVRSDRCRNYRPTNAERVNATHKWASTIMPDSMRLLRRISVQLPLLAICSRGGREDMLHFSLSIVNGEPKLHVAPHVWLKPISRTLLDDHASTISDVARTLKLEGEALIMILVSRPDIWDQLELADM